jgi:hypothetical protein
MTTCAPLWVNFGINSSAFIFESSPAANSSLQLAMGGDAQDVSRDGSKKESLDESAITPEPVTRAGSSGAGQPAGMTPSNVWSSGPRLSASVAPLVQSLSPAAPPDFAQPALIRTALLRKNESRHENQFPGGGISIAAPSENTAVPWITPAYLAGSTAAAESPVAGARLALMPIPALRLFAGATVFEAELATPTAAAATRTTTLYLPSVRGERMATPVRACARHLANTVYFGTNQQLDSFGARAVGF